MCSKVAKLDEPDNFVIHEVYIKLHGLRVIQVFNVKTSKSSSNSLTVGNWIEFTYSKVAEL